MRAKTTGIAALEYRQHIFLVSAAPAAAKVGCSACYRGSTRQHQEQIAIHGQAISALHPEVGFVFQEARLLPWPSVAGNVVFGLAHLPRAERDRRVDIEEAVALATRVIVIKPFPGLIAVSVNIGLPHPRDRLSPAFDDEKRRIMLTLNHSVLREMLPSFAATPTSGHAA